MSAESISSIISAISVILRIAAMMFCLFAGASFQRASTENKVRDMVLGLFLLACGFAASGASLALNGGR